MITETPLGIAASVEGERDRHFAEVVRRAARTRELGLPETTHFGAVRLKEIIREANG